MLNTKKKKVISSIDSPTQLEEDPSLQKKKITCDLYLLVNANKQ